MALNAAKLSAEAAKQAAADKVKADEAMAKSKFNDIKADVYQKVENFKGNASEFTAQALDKTGDVLNNLSDKAQNAADKLRN